MNDRNYLVVLQQPPTRTRSGLLLLLLKNVGSARLRESDAHPISQKTPAPQYQPPDHPPDDPPPTSWFDLLGPDAGNFLR